MSLVRFRDWPPSLLKIFTYTNIYRGQLAQSVEQLTENQCVLGSIPRLATTSIDSFSFMFRCRQTHEQKFASFISALPKEKIAYARNLYIFCYNFFVSNYGDDLASTGASSL